MTTMTTFDQSGDWDDEDFRYPPDIEAPAHFTGFRPAVTNEGILTQLEEISYNPYETTGDIDAEPVEAFDEPRWESYFSGKGIPDEISDDPRGESRFIRTEHIMPGRSIGRIMPRHKK